MPWNDKDALTPQALNSRSGIVTNVRDPAYGATGDGTTDDTTAFNAAITVVGEAGGGRIVVPPGTYVISEIDIDYENVVIEGMTSGYGYEEPSASVTLLCDTGVYAIHLKFTSASRRAQYCALKNLVIKSATAVEYGVVISDGATIMEAVTCQEFQYGCALVAAGNSNVFDRCTFVSNTKAGFVVTESGTTPVAFLHPNLAPLATTTRTTKFSMRDCNIRRNEFGLIIRDGRRALFDNCTIESNLQAGTFIYKSDNANAGSLAYLRFEDCWWENNYDDYTIGAATFAITDINVLKVGASSFITGDQTGDWASVDDAGYQLWIGSETEDRTPTNAPSYLRFTNCTFKGSGTQQHDVRIRSVRFALFDTCEFRTGGNARAKGIELVDAGGGDYYASAVHFFNSEAEQQVAFGEGNVPAVFRQQDGTTTHEIGGITYEYGGVTAPLIGVVDRSEGGQAAITKGMAGLELSARSMNATDKYTPPVKFMSHDPNFTTDNPKLLAYIIGVAFETYGADTDGGMGLDFAVTAQNAGAATVPTVALQISSEGIVTTAGELSVGGDINHDGSNVGFYAATPVAQQTGVGVDAASIHAALVSLGLITA